MNLEQFRQNREMRLRTEKVFRERCLKCSRPPATCYCAAIRAFSAPAEFVILMHRDEARRSIATGRMAHLCLNNSHLLVGVDFTRNERVNALISDPQNLPVVLYPGRESVDVTKISDAECRAIYGRKDRRLVVFLIDATWSQARKIWRLSRNLHSLPQICFTPVTPSKFKVRHQPRSHCYSTIEAIHFLIARLRRDSGAPEGKADYDNLLEVFDLMVARQLEFHERSVIRQGRRRAIRGERTRF